MAIPTTHVIAGGGAAGIFAAIHAAEHCRNTKVLVLEKSREPLAKVAISGGGRCNVTHACLDPAKLVTYYPRGNKALRGVFHRWAPRDTMDWFESRGVPLKTEEDGRIFPVSDQSADIVNALLKAARDVGVEIRTKIALDAARALDGGGFELALSDGSRLNCATLMLATGGNHATTGYTLAAGLGHTIEPPVPSLFTFQCDDDRIRGLQGLSVPGAHVSVEGERLSAEGPLLITHWGFSGPAVLRLSAWGARCLADRDYRFTFKVRWQARETSDAAKERWTQHRRDSGRKRVRNSVPEDLPQRIWDALVWAAGIPDDRTWSLLTRTEETALTDQWLDSQFDVTGKTLFKEEFVTCGGVRLSEVDFRTMESRICSGLYFGGELLDIDGLTGGFNLQSAWATGYLAGLAMAT